MRERDLIRTAESIAADLDEAMQRAHVRKQATDWQMILEEARNLMAFGFVAIVTVYAVLSL